MFHWLCSSIFPCSFVRHVMVTWTLSFTVSYFHFHLQNMQKMHKQWKHSTPGSAVPLAMFPVVFCQITKFDSGYVCFDHRNNKLIDIFKFEIVHVWFEVVLNIWSRADWRIEMGFAVFLSQATQNHCTCKSVCVNRYDCFVSHSQVSPRQAAFS